MNKTLICGHFMNIVYFLTQTGEIPSGDYGDPSQEVCATLRRSSSGHVFEPSTESNQILGTLHCTIRYSFDKNALVVTVNRCENLPAKDSSAKSRYLPLSTYQKKLLYSLHTEIADSQTTNRYQLNSRYKNVTRKRLNVIVNVKLGGK